MPQYGEASGQRTSLSKLDEEKIPLFLIKLWNIIEDPNCATVIVWDESGFSFHITDPYTFCKNVLPQYFKHNNLNSLIRQLNMYGFRKITPIDRTGLTRSESDHEHLEFSHPMFIRDHPELLVNIKRKSATQSRPPVGEQSLSIQPKDLQHILDEVRQLREKQSSMDSKLVKVVKENQTLWQQVSHMRSMHMKQQQVVNKLVQFLVALVQPSSAHKRLGKRQLLAIGPVLDELSQGSKRKRRNSGGASSGAGSGIFPPDFLNRLQRELLEAESPQGPIIAEVTDDTDPAHSSGSRRMSSASPGTTIQQQLIGDNVTLGSREPPLTPAPSDHRVVQMSSPTPNFDWLSPTPAAAPAQFGLNVNGAGQQAQSQPTDFQEVPTNLQLHPQLDRQLSQEFGEYLAGIDEGLDNCRDLLLNNGVHLDPETMRDLFDLVDDTPPPPDAQQVTDPQQTPTTMSSPSRLGNEVAVYQQRPTFFLQMNQPPTTTTANQTNAGSVPTGNVTYSCVDAPTYGMNEGQPLGSHLASSSNELHTPVISPTASAQSLPLLTIPADSNRPVVSVTRSAKGKRNAKK